MPVKGARLVVCANGHDLTLPNARIPPGRNGRGDGDCRQCRVERDRARRGSKKSGPPSRYKGDETARLAALAIGKKRCPECGEAKDPAVFNRDRGSADGLSCYCRDCRRAQKTADYLARREDILLRKQAQTFGVTTDRLLALREAQHNRCAICMRACPTGRALAVDHDHRTGEIRGLLCANCNRAIGLLQDSIAVVHATAAYLERWADRVEASVQHAGMPKPD